MEIVLATRNEGKIDEIRAIFSDLPIMWKGLESWPDMTDMAETGETFEENALIKGHAAANRLRRWSVADDSGLEVDALHGRPGVRSARYAGYGEDPIQKLLNELSGVPEEKRTARFVCVACLCGPKGEEYLKRGVLEGHIATTRAGEHGFGFDPIFIPEGHRLRLAEIVQSEKNRISHRARAFNALRLAIEDVAGRA